MPFMQYDESLIQEHVAGGNEGGTKFYGILDWTDFGTTRKGVGFEIHYLMLRSGTISGMDYKYYPDFKKIKGYGHGSMQPVNPERTNHNSASKFYRWE